MHIAHHPGSRRLAVLHKNTVRLYDVASGEAALLGAVEVADADNLHACDGWIGVLAGKIAPADASLRNATLTRFDWNLAPLPSPSVGEVARRTLSPSHDGARVALVRWDAARVTVFDATTGEVLCANGESIPSGPSFSPDGRWVLAGTADQGKGAVLRFDTHTVSAGLMAMERLPPPRPKHPGLDDAPYFSVWSEDGALAALSNESWGGRGITVYDLAAPASLWSATLPCSSEESEEWFAFQAVFTRDARALLLAGPESLHAYNARTGAPIATLPLPTDGRRGFALDESAWRVWLPGETPIALALPDDWRGE